MKRNLKRIISMIVLVGVVCLRVKCDAGIVDASQKRTCEVMDDTITKNYANKIAEYQVNKTIGKKSGKWQQNTSINKTYNLYNEDGNVVAYAVELSNQNDEAGYVVIGANEENPPVIEFKTSGKFLKRHLGSNEYIIYDGFTNYYIVNKDTQIATSIDDSKEKFNINQLEKRTEKQNLKKSIKCEDKKEWDAIKKEIKSGASNPPTSGGANTTPWAYESGYVRQEFKTVPDANYYRYFIMTQFDDGPVCVATAACNLLNYYMCRQRMKTSLVLNNDWQQTFNRLKIYFKTGKDGASIYDAKEGLEKYFRDLNIQDAVVHYYDSSEDKADWDEVKRRLDFGEPLIYGITDHYYYTRNEEGKIIGKHAVLAVGYREYYYAGELNTSKYIQIADGWTDHADRYINVDVGQNNAATEMLTLYFVYSYIQK